MTYTNSTGNLCSFPLNSSTILLTLQCYSWEIPPFVYLFRGQQTDFEGSLNIGVLFKYLLIECFCNKNLKENLRWCWNLFFQENGHNWLKLIILLLLQQQHTQCIPTKWGLGEGRVYADLTFTLPQRWGREIVFNRPSVHYEHARLY